jgi:phosphoribosylaminoimidazole-succinocarboxamide synthase
MIERQALLDAIPHCLTATDLPLTAKTLPDKYVGKVRDTYDLAMAACCW